MYKDFQPAFIGMLRAMIEEAQRLGDNSIDIEQIIKNAERVFCDVKEMRCDR